MICEHSVVLRILIRFPSAGLKCFATFVFASSLFCSLIFPGYILISFISKSCLWSWKKTEYNEWFRHTFFQRGWGLSDDTYVLYAWCSKIVRGPQKEKIRNLTKWCLFILYIFFSFFVLQFLLCPNWSFSKDVYKTMEKTLVIFSLPDLII